MKIFVSAAVLLSIILVLACGNSSEGLMDPLAGDSQDYHNGGSGDTEICHGNMEALSDGVCQFYGKYNNYPECLEDLAMINPELCSLTCPACGLHYEYETDISENFLIGCPLPQDPDHGYIENGFPMWPPDPSQWMTVCQHHMRWIASACAMYYGKYNTYPDELDDLVAEGFLTGTLYCPACEQSYVYSSDTCNTYTVCCPLPIDPTHGYIIDGFCYFPPDTTGSEGACHSNMCSLASGMSMYYGRYNRYPEELSLLGTSGIMGNWDKPCPACGEIYHYWTDAEGQIYLIQCPLPFDPGHGSVYDGMISWE